MVDAPVVNKIEEAFGCDPSLFPQIAQYADKPADCLPYYELFVEAGDNDCEARPGSRLIGRNRSAIVEFVLSHRAEPRDS
jgi:hypothetical protein